MNMWCPDGIGRDSWDRGEPASVFGQALTPPKNLGEETCSLNWGSTPKKNGTIPIAIVIVVVVEVVVS